MLTFPVRALLVAVVVSVSCAPYVGDPRFGPLQRDQRQFRFRHNIELFEVSNGMRVALIPDDRTNLATIDVRYDVGAAEDPPGKAGLAHLVEHLAFMLRAESGGPTIFEELGEIALHYNAHTSSDETHYTSTVPIEQLERVIAIEGRRMRAPCDQLDEATFRRERDVVLAEEAERATPNDDAWYELMAAVYGAAHPYARPVGSREVASATRADACAFMEQHYAPNRAFVVITGPFKAAAIRDLVGKAFGPIRRQATRRRVADPLVLTGKRSRHEAPIDHPIAIVVFPRAPWGGDVKFRVAEARLGAVMSEADRGRAWILGTAVTTIGGPRAPAIAVMVEVDDEAKLTDAVDEVHAQAQKLFHELSPRGLARVRAQLELSLVAGWDDLESRGGWIADFMQYTDHNWFMLAEMKALDQTDWERASEELAGVLSREHSHAALVVPSGKKSGRRLAAAVPAGAHDQVPWRAPVDAAEADRPLTLAAGSPASVERYTLANGLNVELARDPKSPIVDVRLVFPVGSAHEPADRYGISYAAAFLLDHDEDRRYPQSTLDLLEWGISRGTNIGWSVSETTTTFSAIGVSEWGDWHLWYLSWLIDQGRYNQSQLEEMHRVARELSASSADDEVDRGALAFGQRLYGRGHPYAAPPPNAGAAYLALGARDLERWKRERYRARGATLVVSGAFDPEQMKRLVDELYGPWSGDAPPALPAVPAARPTP
ncbi:MAG: insulinase family protein, partial [Deltaproteobacteria bacterium]|nr:insulinase family protein [Kofleriaceae bacterium]